MISPSTVSCAFNGSFFWSLWVLILLFIGWGRHYVWEILHSTIRKMNKHVQKIQKELEEAKDKLEKQQHKKVWEIAVLSPRLCSDIVLTFVLVDLDHKLILIDHTRPFLHVLNALNALMFCEYKGCQIFHKNGHICLKKKKNLQA